MKDRIGKKARTYRDRIIFGAYSLRVVAYLGWMNLLAGIQRHFRRNGLRYYVGLYALISLGVAGQLYGAYLERDGWLTFFTSGAALVGASLAIIMTFNTLIINYTGVEYPPELYKDLGYDWRQNLIYVLLAFDSLTLFSLSLAWPGNGLFVSAGVLLIATSFYLLFASYLITRDRLDPSKGLGRIYKRNVAYLRKTAALGGKLSKLNAANPKLKEQEKDYAKQYAYNMLQPRFSYTTRQIGHLHDYHDKLYFKQNFGTALSVLDTIHNILVNYVLIRVDNMSTFPSSFLLVSVTDSQGFFETNLQRLVNKAKRYIDNQDDEGAIKIANNLMNLAFYASDVKFKRETENPLVEQIEGYLGLINDYAIQKNSLEVLFQTAIMYGKLGQMAVNKNYIFSKDPSYKTLNKIGRWAIANDQSPVLMKVAESYSNILVALLQNDAADTRDVENLFKNYGQTFLLYVVGLNVSKIDGTHLTPHVLQPYTVLQRYILGRIRENSESDHDRRGLNKILEPADAIRSSLRNISDKTGIEDNFLQSELSSILRSLCVAELSLLRNKHWKHYEGEIVGSVTWLVHQISWLQHKTKSFDEYPLGELMDDTASVGYSAINAKSPKVAEASVEVLSQLILHFMTKNKKSIGYEAARNMTLVALLGVYADKNGMTSVAQKTRDVLTKLDEQYVSKYFPDGPPQIPEGVGYLGTHPDQWRRELDELFNSSFNELGIRSGIELPSDKLLENIAEADKDAYIAKYLPPTPKVGENTKGASDKKKAPKNKK